MVLIKGAIVKYGLEIRPLDVTKSRVFLVFRQMFTLKKRCSITVSVTRFNVKPTTVMDLCKLDNYAGN